MFSVGAHIQLKPLATRAKPQIINNFIKTTNSAENSKIADHQVSGQSISVLEIPILLLKF